MLESGHAHACPCCKFFQTQGLGEVRPKPSDRLRGLVTLETLTLKPMDKAVHDLALGKVA